MSTDPRQILYKKDNKGDFMKKNSVIKKLLALGAFSLMLNGLQANACENQCPPPSQPNFSMAMGSVFIAAPTALMGPTNQGIWFLKPSDKSFSLELPMLPKDQVYEGWLVNAITGEKISTGSFRHLGGIDSDAAGPFAGPMNLDFPPQPGSDFVTLGDDIAAGKYAVVVTVEPYPNTTGMHPAGFPILKADIPVGTMLGAELQLVNLK